MSDLAAGIRYFGRGQRWVAQHGRLYAFCLLPALIALVLYAAVLIWFATQVGDVAAWATPFADGWSDGPRAVLRVTFGLLLFCGVLLLAVLTFTAVTLLIGDPFYEKLSERVEESEGGGPTAPDRPLWREIWTSITDSLHVLVRAVAFALLVFALSFVPLIGQTLVPALGFAISGFFLAVELTSVAMQRRGIDVRTRLRMLRERKALAVGFGVPVLLGFLVPLGGVLLMPGAVAGATLLVRDLTGTPGDQAGPGPGDERTPYDQAYPPPYPPGGPLDRSKRP